MSMSNINADSDEQSQLNEIMASISRAEVARARAQSTPVAHTLTLTINSGQCVQVCGFDASRVSIAFTPTSADDACYLSATPIDPASLTSPSYEAMLIPQYGWLVHTQAPLWVSADAVKSCQVSILTLSRSGQ